MIKISLESRRSKSHTWAPLNVRAPVSLNVHLTVTNYRLEKVRNDYILYMYIYITLRNKTVGNKIMEFAVFFCPLSL